MLQGLGRISFMKGSAGMLENNASKRSWVPLVIHVPLKHLCDSGESFEPWFWSEFPASGRIRMSQKALRLSCTSFSGSIMLGTVIFISNHSPALWGAGPGRAARSSRALSVFSPAQTQNCTAGSGLSCREQSPFLPQTLQRCRSSVVISSRMPSLLALCFRVSLKPLPLPEVETT